MDLSIIIVNWNTKDLLYKCVESIYRNVTNLSYEIVIVDNDSIDGSCEGVENIANNIKIIFSKENLGFSKGNNVGVDNSRGKYLLFLNPDTIILDDAIQKSLVAIKQLGDEHLLGVRLLNSDKTLQISSCDFPNIINSFFSTYTKSYKKHYSNHYTDWVMGAYMLISREFYNKVGRLNESYFMYSEDLELCYKVKKSGGKVIFKGDLEIVHLYNQSGKGKWNEKRDKVVLNSTIKFLKENYTGIEKMAVIGILKLRYNVKKIIKR